MSPPSRGDTVLSRPLPQLHPQLHHHAVQQAAPGSGGGATLVIKNEQGSQVTDEIPNILCLFLYILWSRQWHFIQCSGHLGYYVASVKCQMFRFLLRFSTGKGGNFSEDNKYTTNREFNFPSCISDRRVVLASPSSAAATAAEWCEAEEEGAASVLGTVGHSECDSSSEQLSSIPQSTPMNVLLS